MSRATQVEASSAVTAREPIQRTDTCVIHPILGCLKIAEQEIGVGRVWREANDLQRQFLDEFFPALNEVTTFSAAELRCLLSKHAEAINQFLAENGFQIKLDPLGELEFGVASVLNVLVEWLSLGQVTELELNGRGKFPAVHLKGEQGAMVYENEVQGTPPIVGIATKTGDRVFLSMTQDTYRGFDITRRVKRLRQAVASGGYRPSSRYAGAVFPMVHFDQEVDIAWLLGMSTTDSRGVPVWISQAKQQTRFRMNERGARAESAVAMGMKRLGVASMRKPYIVDQPFLCWIERQGLELPIFSGVFAEDVWRNPGSLD